MCLRGLSTPKLSQITLQTGVGAILLEYIKDRRILMCGETIEEAKSRDINQVTSIS